MNILNQAQDTPRSTNHRPLTVLYGRRKEPELLPGAAIAPVGPSCLLSAAAESLIRWRGRAVHPLILVAFTFGLLFATMGTVKVALLGPHRSGLWSSAGPCRGSISLLVWVEILFRSPACFS